MVKYKHEEVTETQKGFKIVFQTVKYFYPIVWKEKPLFFLVYLINVLINAAHPFIDIFFVKALLDELMGEKNIHTVLVYIIILVGGNALCYLVMNLCHETIGKYEDAFNRYFEMQISTKAMSMAFELTEDKEMLNQSEKASIGMQGYSGGVVGITASLTGIITSCLTLVGASIIMIKNTPILILVILIAVIISAILNAKVNVIQVKHFLKLADLNRAFGYIYWNITDFKYGKDVRLYGASKMLLHKANHFNDEQTSRWRSQAQESNKLNVLDDLVGALRDGVTYLYLGYLILTKVISVGEFTMLGAAGSTFQNCIRSTIFNIQELQKKCIYAYEFVKFMNHPTNLTHGEQELELKEQHTIEFKEVTFRYPNTEEDILKNVSLTIKSGEHLSIVGLNGAGKTTFIKLLCRLYDVNEGAILLDGVNIKAYEYDEYVKLFAVVFQDFKLFSFSFKENIALDGSESILDEDIKTYIALSGLEEKVYSLEKGLHTTLFKQFEEDGIEPSGGEQQKLAIARALYRNAPIVILDEPTAALDPIAEYEIYRQFDQLVGGKTAIYISHRLSSCKFCDQIAVFSEGTVKEYGHHDFLVKLEEGIYAQMFSAQAQYYT